MGIISDIAREACSGYYSQGFNAGFNSGWGQGMIIGMFLGVIVILLLFTVRAFMDGRKS